MSQLFAGASRISITPTDEMYPLYRGYRPDDNRLAPEYKDSILVGNLDPLYARSLALKSGEETIVIVALDYIVVPAGEKHVRRISEALNLPEKNVYLIATHTHNVPAVSTRFGSEEPSDDFKKLLAEKPEDAKRQLAFEQLLLDGMLQAAVEAVQHLEPASVGIGSTDSYINVNRDQVYTGEYHMGYNGAGHSDKTAALIRFAGQDGHTIARLANYACHAISAYLNRCCKDGASGTTGDIPGLVSRTFEELDPGSVCLWTPAAQGNQNPMFMNFVSYPDPATGEVREELLTPGSYQVTKVLGYRHVADLKRAEQSITDYQSDVCIRTCREVLPMPIDPNKPHSRWHRPNQGDTQNVIVSGLKIGDIFFFGLGGELYSDVGAHLKALSPIKNTMIWTLCIGCAGYMMNDKDLTAPTLFAKRTLWKPGCLVPAFEGALKRFTAEEEAKS